MFTDSGSRSRTAHLGRPHDLLVVSTEKLLAAHGDEVELYPLDSGAVHAGAVVTRGADIWRRLTDYPREERRRIARREPVVELTVPYAVRDIADLVEDVQTL